MSVALKHKVWICGQGAIGSLFGAYCVTKGVDVAYITTRPRNIGTCVELLPEITESQLNETTHYELPTPQLLPVKEEIEILIITVKAAHVIQALNQVQPFLTDHCHIILSHNGLGTIEEAKSIMLPTQSLYFCTTSFGALKQGDQVIETGIGVSIWSLVQKGVGVQPLNQQHMANLFPNAKESDSLTEILWTKLAVNAVINPLTALHDIKNGEINHQRFDKIKVAVLNELILVAKHSGVTLELQPLIELVESVANRTKDNSSSMRQDIKNKRATEVDFINGFIVQEAKANNVKAPINSQLWQQVKDLESSLS